MFQKRTEMIRVLQKLVVPLLRERGFKGSFPHFRRAQQKRLDLVSFQFHRFGREFVIEIAQCNLADKFWNKNEPLQKLRCWDLHPRQRVRIHPTEGPDWFRYDEAGGTIQSAALSVVACLDRIYTIFDDFGSVKKMG
jgi:hypothetical protein